MWRAHCRKSFNPTMVRLLRDGNGSTKAASTEVSIPQWCDCCTHLSPLPVQRPALFQSHNGAIAAFVIALCYKHLPKVSIPQWCDCCGGDSYVGEMAVSVSIPQWCDCCPSYLKPVLCRNLVSIPQWCDCCWFTPVKWFTPTTVSIPQWCDCCNQVQFAFRSAREVSIPQWCDCCSSAEQRKLRGNFGFNPTMVRLLPAQTSLAQSLARLFQSHNGAIAACVCDECGAEVDEVSIPQWCDCCPQPARGRSVKRSHCFNPTMVRLLRVLIVRDICADLSFNPTMVRLLPLMVRSRLLLS